jgi:hypothetical protein
LPAGILGGIAAGTTREETETMPTDTATTAYAIEGPAGTHHGRSAQRLSHTIAADAHQEGTDTPWQRIEHRELDYGADDRTLLQTGSAPD